MPLPCEAAIVLALLCLCFFIGFYNWDDLFLSDTEAIMIRPVSEMMKQPPGKFQIPMISSGYTAGNVLLIPFMAFFEDPGLAHKLGQSIFAALGLLFTYLFTRKMFGIAASVPAAALMAAVPTYALANDPEGPFLAFLSALFLYVGACYYLHRSKASLYAAAWLLGFMFFYKLIFAYTAFAFAAAFWALEGRRHGLKRTGIGRKDAAVCGALFLVGLLPFLVFNFLPDSLGGSCCATENGSMPAVVRAALSMFQATGNDYNILAIIPNIITRCSQLLVIASEESMIEADFTFQELGLGGCFLLVALILIAFKRERRWVFLALALAAFTITAIFVTKDLNATHWFAIFPVISVVRAYPFMMGFRIRGRTLKLAAIMLAALFSAGLIADVRMMLTYDDQKFVERHLRDKAIFNRELLAEIGNAKTVVGVMDLGTAWKIYLKPSVKHLHAVELCPRWAGSGCDEETESFKEEFHAMTREYPVVYVLPSPDRVETPDFLPYIFSCPAGPGNKTDCGVFYEEFGKLLGTEGKSLMERGKVYDRTTGQPVWTVYYAE